MSGFENVEFWLEHMLEYEMNAELSWEWAFCVYWNGEISVRHGPFWHDTGIYATKRRITGCEWE